MRRFAVLLAAGLLFTACGKGGNRGAEGSPPPKPRGMEIAAKEGTGRVFSARLSGNSASQMLHGFVEQATPYFDAPPHIAHAMRNQADTHARVAFEGRLRNKPVRGLFFVTAEGDGGRGLLTIDYADRIAGSFRALMAHSGQAMPSASANAPAQVAPLHETRMPANYGTINIPKGWRFAPTPDGGISVNGPGGAQLALAGHTVLTTPQFARQYPQVPHISSMDPVRSLQEVTAQMARRAGKQARLQVLGVQRISIPQGPAAFVRYRVAIPGKVMDAFGFYVLTQTSPMQVVAQGSTFHAPPGAFAKLLPTAIAMETNASVATTHAPTSPDAINIDNRMTPAPVVLPARKP